MDKCKEMLAKLSASTNEAQGKPALQAMRDKVEGKLMDLQGQLRAVKEQRERGDLASDTAVAGSTPTATPDAEEGGARGGGPARGGGGGGRAGGAWGRGGRAVLGRMGGRGGRSAGRSWGGGRLGHASIDNRPKVLLVTGPPPSLVHTAAAHFSR